MIEILFTKIYEIMDEYIGATITEETEQFVSICQCLCTLFVMIIGVILIMKMLLTILGVKIKK